MGLVHRRFNNRDPLGYGRDFDRDRCCYQACHGCRGNALGRLAVLQRLAGLHCDSRRGDFIGDEYTDLDGAFALTSFFTRMAERGDDVPDLEDVANSTAAAILYGESLYGKGFFSK